MAITTFYFIASFNKDLPWKDCNPKWEDYCFKNGTAINKTTIPAQLYYE